MRNVIIIGGGLAGLVAGIRLIRQGFTTSIVEKHKYPRHKVCGEYISMEVHDFLDDEKLLPRNTDLPFITKLLISSIHGETVTFNLKKGGFGVSRYFYENLLYQIAKEEGVEFIHEEAVSLSPKSVILKNGTAITADLIIAAYGKRTKLDKELKRRFINRRSPYAGIKFHAKLPSHDAGMISLHNFNGGYCGVCNVEDGITNICYLIERDKIKRAGSIGKVEKEILSQNPHLKKLFNEAKMIFQKPLVINEISFETKSPVENNIPMIGDAAGMITPLCGNGMAMAIHSAKLLTDLIINNPQVSVEELCFGYAYIWRDKFGKRLSWGRFVQRNLFGKGWASATAVLIGRNMPSLANHIISKTHGENV